MAHLARARGWRAMGSANCSPSSSRLSLSLRLAVVCALAGWAEAARRTSTPEFSPPPLGSVTEWSSPESYLKGHQLVGLLPPSSSSSRLIDAKTKQFTRPTSDAAITWRIRRVGKRRGARRTPFKARLLKLDPRGIIGTLATEERIGYLSDKKAHVSTLVILKPKPWWQRLF